MSSLRSEMERIYQRHEALSPELVVKEWKPPKHPFHDRLEWNDAIAGHEYRLIQAADYIRSIKVVTHQTADGTPVRNRWWHPVRVDAPSVYDPLDKIVEDEIATAALVRTMEREWKQMKRRFDRFAEFWDIVRRDVA